MKLTTKKILNLRAALLALDGLDKAVEVNGKTALIKKPFKLAGKTRLKIARNLRELESPATDYDEARIALVRELSGGGDDVPADQRAEFFTQINPMLAAEHEVGLAAFAEDEFNLEANEIPHGALALLLEHLVATAPATPAETARANPENE